MATVKQWIKSLGKDSLIEVINPKYNALQKEIKELETLINEHYNGSGKQEFHSVMENHNIPMEDWAIYRSVFEWRVCQPKERLKKLKKELYNILPIWVVLNEVTLNDRNEAFKIKVENAKQYPIENMYRGATRSLGKRIMGKCPFHEDSSPSFFVFTNDNHFHCFGCGARGDAIEFYMRTQNCDFKTAVNALQ